MFWMNRIHNAGIAAAHASGDHQGNNQSNISKSSNIFRHLMDSLLHATTGREGENSQIFHDNQLTLTLDLPGKSGSIFVNTEIRLNPSSSENSQILSIAFHSNGRWQNPSTPSAEESVLTEPLKTLFLAVSNWLREKGQPADSFRVEIAVPSGFVREQTTPLGTNIRVQNLSKTGLTEEENYHSPENPQEFNDQTEREFTVSTVVSQSSMEKESNRNNTFPRDSKAERTSVHPTPSATGKREFPSDREIKDVVYPSKDVMSPLNESFPDPVPATFLSARKTVPTGPADPNSVPDPVLSTNNGTNSSMDLLNRPELQPFPSLRKADFSGRQADKRSYPAVPGVEQQIKLSEFQKNNGHFPKSPSMAFTAKAADINSDSGNSPLSESSLSLPLNDPLQPPNIKPVSNLTEQTDSLSIVLPDNPDHHQGEIRGVDPVIFINNHPISDKATYRTIPADSPEHGHQYREREGTNPTAEALVQGPDFIIVSISHPIQSNEGMTETEFSYSNLSGEVHSDPKIFLTTAPSDHIQSLLIENTSDNSSFLFPSETESFSFPQQARETSAQSATENFIFSTVMRLVHILLEGKDSNDPGFNPPASDASLYLFPRDSFSSANPKPTEYTGGAPTGKSTKLSGQNRENLSSGNVLSHDISEHVPSLQTVESRFDPGKQSILLESGSENPLSLTDHQSDQQYSTMPLREGTVTYPADQTTKEHAESSIHTSPHPASRQGVSGKNFTGWSIDFSHSIRDIHKSGTETAFVNSDQGDDASFHQQFQDLSVGNEKSDPAPSSGFSTFARTAVHTEQPDFAPEPGKYITAGSRNSSAQRMMESETGNSSVQFQSHGTIRENGQHRDFILRPAAPPAESMRNENVLKYRSGGNTASSDVSSISLMQFAEKNEIPEPSLAGNHFSSPLDDRPGYLLKSQLHFNMSFDMGDEASLQKGNYNDHTSGSTNLGGKFSSGGFSHSPDRRLEHMIGNQDKHPSRSALSSALARDEHISEFSREFKREFIHHSLSGSDPFSKKAMDFGKLPVDNIHPHPNRTSVHFLRLENNFQFFHENSTISFPNLSGGDRETEELPSKRADKLSNHHHGIAIENSEKVETQSAGTSQHFFRQKDDNGFSMHQEKVKLGGDPDGDSTAREPFRNIPEVRPANTGNGIPLAGSKPGWSAHSPVSDLFREISRQISLKISARKADIHIRVQDEQFGQLKIKMVMKGELARMVVITESEEAREMLKKHAHELVENLSSRGIRVERMDFWTTSERPNVPEHLLAGHSGEDRRRHHQSNPQRGYSGEDKELVTHPNPPAHRTRGLSRGLDIFI